VGTARYFAFCCAKASLRLHGACFTTLLRAPLSWFESTPSGRVISRFAADLENMDMNWSTNVDVLLTMGAMAGMLLIVMSLLVPYLIPVNIVCLSILFRAISLINCTNRDVKRIANNSVSPAVTTMSEAERGRVVAHAIGCSSFFVERQKGNVDNMLTAFFFSNAINNAAWAVALVMSCLISTCTLLFVLYSGLVPAERKAIALSYALIAPFFTGTGSLPSLLPSHCRMKPYLFSHEVLQIVRSSIVRYGLQRRTRGLDTCDLARASV
jgi:ABC-type multidrug transport system fused ATPase/permease subunit